MNQQMVLPDGGLASFLLSNMDEFDDSRLAFGRQNGINSMRETAEKMARMGRNGDVHVGHLEHGEGVVPRQVRENNPELVRAIDSAIAAEGADPSAYVVGSDTNSINPYTGQREFFLKKLVRGVKKIFKKVAPIIIPFALNLIAPGLGTVASGFIGGGITALAQGANFKDALKAGLVGGAMGGITSGMQGVMNKNATGTFTEKFGQGLRSGAGIDKNNIFGQKGDPRSIMGRPFEASTIDPNAKPTFGQKVMDFAMPKADPSQAQINELIGKYTAQGVSPDVALQQATQQLTPGFLSKYGGTIATGTAAAAAAGAFDPIPAEEVEDPYDGPSPSETRFAENPDKYRVGQPGAPTYVTLADTLKPASYTPYYQDYLPQEAARGGEMFPRRNGYIAGPGTETSDDIPAMLSDGEFVMTAQAVRGVGNGNRQQGVRKMYDMMRAFEGGAVA
tara:strand:+ start:3400 stop:4743 length:1344 start_codon:yes stop_codon:yes gene_type:complete